MKQVTIFALSCLLLMGCKNPSNPSGGDVEDPGVPNREQIDLYLETDPNTLFTHADSVAEANLPAAERNRLALQFIDEFYEKANTDEEGIYKWDEATLCKYLAPDVIRTLRQMAQDDETEASESESLAWWMLTGVDATEQILLRSMGDAQVDDEGRYMKGFEVAYWADAFYGYQTLYYTVFGLPDHPLITRIDGMSTTAAEGVWQQLEDRDLWRDMGGEEDEVDDPDIVEEE